MILKATSVVGAIHELPQQRSYHQIMINKNLKRRVDVNIQHNSFVQCVSHKLGKYVIIITKLGKISGVNSR